MVELIVVFLISICGTFLIRWYRWKKIERIEVEYQDSQLFLKKIGNFKEREKARNKKMTIIFLFLSILLTYIGIALLENTANHLRNDLQNLELRASRTERDLDKSNILNSLKDYPEVGINLQDMDWKTELAIGNSSESNLNFEQKLVDKVRPYFGSSDIFIRINSEDSSISVAIISKIPISKVKKNIELFVKEVKKVSGLNRIEIQWNDTVSLKTLTYSRSSITKEFS